MRTIDRSKRAKASLPALQRELRTFLVARACEVSKATLSDFADSVDLSSQRWAEWLTLPGNLGNQITKPDGVSS